MIPICGVKRSVKCGVGSNREHQCDRTSSIYIDWVSILFFPSFYAAFATSNAHSNRCSYLRLCTATYLFASIIERYTELLHCAKSFFFSGMNCSNLYPIFFKIRNSSLTCSYKCTIPNLAWQQYANISNWIKNSSGYSN